MIIYIMILFKLVKGKNYRTSPGMSENGPCRFAGRRGYSGVEKQGGSNHLKGGFGLLFYAAVRQISKVLICSLAYKSTMSPVLWFSDTPPYEKVFKRSPP
jgi:hypothetical protein